jgi:hypothetical protein
MKYTTIAFGLLLSFSSFATQVKGFEIKGLPTASDSFSKKVYNEGQVDSAKLSVQEQCLSGKAEAQAFLRGQGFKVISSVGCEQVSVENRNSDMSLEGIVVSANYEVLFK